MFARTTYPMPIINDLPLYHTKINQPSIVLEDLKSPADHKNMINLNQTLNVSTYNGQQSFNLISPSSIPNPSPSISTKPSLLMQDSPFLPYPYNSTLPSHMVYQTGQFLSNTTDCQNTYSISGSIQSVKTNTPIMPFQKDVYEPTLPVMSEKPKSPLQTDFEEHFYPKIVPQIKLVKEQSNVESKKVDQVFNNNKIEEVPNKPSLKTSIPISKIDFFLTSQYNNAPPIKDDVKKHQDFHTTITNDGSIFLSNEMPKTPKQKFESFTWHYQDKPNDTIHPVYVSDKNTDLEGDSNAKYVYLPKVMPVNQKQSTLNPLLISKTQEDKSKKSKERILVTENIPESKVVALKRLHQDNGDENDFENLITENQIYGNKIVVKEKSQSNDAKNTQNEDVAYNKPMQSKENKYVFNYMSMIESQPDIINNNQLTFVNQTIKTINPLTQSLSYVKTNMIETKCNNVLQTLLNKPLTCTKPNQYVYKVPLLMEGDDCANLEKPTYQNSELANLLSKQSLPKTEWNNNNSSSFKNIKIKSERLNAATQEEVLSSLDLAERRKRKRRETKNIKPERIKQSHLKTIADDVQEFRLSYKQYQMYVGIVGEKYFEESTSEESESESEEEDTLLNDVKRLTSSPTPLENSDEKMNFLNMFGLTTILEKNERELQMVEKSVKLDSITAATILVSEIVPPMSLESGFSLPLPKITEEAINTSSKRINDKVVFLNELKLGMVSNAYKLEREKMWQTTLKERKRRNGESALLQYFENLSNIQFKKNEPKKLETINTHARGQLEIMTKIKQSVNDTNNLIKRAIDNLYHSGNEKSDDNIIPALAERNFSEISKLSSMANRSLKMFGRSQNGTLVENERKDESYTNIPKLNIPNIPKIISLKTMQDVSTMDISSATSMDEPRNSAAGIQEGKESRNPVMLVYATPPMPSNLDNMKFSSYYRKCDEVKSHTEYKWPGIEGVISAYNKYNEECKSEHTMLLHENSRLLREVMALQMEANNVSTELRQILAKQQVCEEQHRSLQTSFDNINNCIKYLMIQ